MKKQKKRTINRKEKIKSIFLNSHNIQLISKDGSVLKCRCGNCQQIFKVIGYMNRNKIVCPICKNNELAERKREKRINNIKSEVTTIKRKCSYMPYCFSTNKYLCSACAVKAEPYYTKSEFSKIVNDANKSITVIGNYIDSHTPIKYKCNICENVYFGKPYNLLKGVCGCRNCNKSNGERIISLYLMEHDIYYETEKVFDDCRYKRPLRFDFYIPDFNIAIEYDGKQHFEPVRFKKCQNPEENFRSTKIRDEIKNQYCKENNIALIRISYMDEDIYHLLDDCLMPIINAG